MPDFYIFSDTSNFIQRTVKVSAAPKLGRRCRPTVLRRYESRPWEASPEGGFLGGDYQVLCKPRSEGGSGQPEQRMDSLV